MVNVSLSSYTLKNFQFEWYPLYHFRFEYDDEDFKKVVGILNTFVKANPYFSIPNVYPYVGDIAMALFKVGVILNLRFKPDEGSACGISHYSDVIMSAMASQFASFMSVYSTVYSGADQRKHQSSASLAFVRGIHRWLMNSPRKGPVTRKMFPFDDVIMSWNMTTVFVCFVLFFDYVVFFMNPCDSFTHILQGCFTLKVMCEIVRYQPKKAHIKLESCTYFCAVLYI